MYKLPNIAHAVTKQRTARQKYFSILKFGFKEKCDASVTVVFVWFISMSDQWILDMLTDAGEKWRSVRFLREQLSLRIDNQIHARELKVRGPPPSFC